MAKYLVLWKVDEDKMPADPKEKKQMLLEAVKQLKKELKSGIVKDWGTCLGESHGYSIIEGNDLETHARHVGWMPMAKFTVHRVLTLDEVEKAYKGLPE